MDPKIVLPEEWIEARKRLLEDEKAHTRARDALNAKRRQLPCVKVEKPYFFDTPDGKKTLSELFDGRSQLILYHFMWRRELDAGCVGCSFLCDHVDGANMHLANHDVTFVAVSRAPLANLMAFKKRMGWRFPWVSSLNSTFNFDYHVSFTPEELANGTAYYNYREMKVEIEEASGISVFYKDEAGHIFHTYSSYGRGNEEVLGAYMYLDIAPKGRNETSMTDWVRHHDRYGAGGYVDHTGGYIEESATEDSCCHPGKEAGIASESRP